MGKDGGRESQRGMDGKAHGIITESSQRMRGRTIRTKAIEAAKVQAFFFWLLLYSRAISRRGGGHNGDSGGKEMQQSRAESHDHETESRQGDKEPNKSHTDVIFIDNAAWPKIF